MTCIVNSPFVPLMVLTIHSLLMKHILSCDECDDDPQSLSGFPLSNKTFGISSLLYSGIRKSGHSYKEVTSDSLLLKGNL